MFGRTKPAKVEEPTVWGWREADLAWVEKCLSGDRPLIQLEVVGFRQCFAVDGRKYGSKVSSLRHDHEMYERHALLFDGIPGVENLLSPVSHDNELLGKLLYPWVRAEGSFSVATDPEKLKGGVVGGLTFTARGTDDTSYSPQVEFDFEVLNTQEEFALQRMIQSNIGRQSKVWLSLSLCKVDQPADALARLREEGFSSYLQVHSVYVSAQVGIPRHPDF